MYGLMAQNPRKSALKSEIDTNLKRVYEEVLKEDVPDRFKDLLAQLRQKDLAPKDTGPKSGVEGENK